MVTPALLLVAVSAVAMLTFAMLADMTAAHDLPLFEALPDQVDQTTRHRPAR